MEMVGQLKIKGKIFSECFRIDHDFRVPSEMKDDACLIYIQEGLQEIISPVEKIVVQDKESVLLKCGNYIANLKGKEKPLKSMVFHLDPEIISEGFSK